VFITGNKLLDLIDGLDMGTMRMSFFALSSLDLEFNLKQTGVDSS